MSAMWALECADCRLWLPTLAERSVDLVLTDPPYEAEAHTRGRRLRGGLGVVERPIPFAAITETERVAAAINIARIARRWVVTFCQVEAAPLWRAAYEAAGLRYMRTCIWVKPDGAPQFTGDRPGMGYETILVMHTDARSRWNGGGRHGVFTCLVGGKHQHHPTEKPVRLMRDLVRLFSDPGETVCDPFAGSGTTLLAAVLEGRKAIGCELAAGYVAVARDRLHQAQPEGTMAVPLFPLNWGD